MKTEPEQQPLFEKGEWWEEHWKGMPEFVQKQIEPFKTVYVHFENRADMESFARLINQQLTLNTKSIWYPEAEINDFSKIKYISEYEPGPEKPSDILEQE
jgi:hypothetical protein